MQVLKQQKNFHGQTQQERLYLMFDFFKKYFSKTEKKEDEPIASLTFYIKSDNTIPIIDVGLAGFEDDSLICLASILNRVFTDQAKLESLEIIKKAFIANKEEDALIKLFSLIEIVNYKTMEQNDGPCIKPSQML